MSRLERREVDNLMNKAPLQNLPKEYKIYFWDVEWDDLQSNTEQYTLFIISRLVDKGDVHVIHWLKQYYSCREIFEVVKKSRTVSTKTRQFWCNYEKFLREGAEQHSS